MRHVEKPQVRDKHLAWGCLAVFAAFFAAACARAPVIETKPEPEPPPPPPKFAMQPYHRSMSDEMKASYARADEILVGMIEGVVSDKTLGPVCYVSDFRRFDKDNLSWEPSQSTVMQILPDKLRPDIIRHGEFKRLIDLDKIGICWDLENGRRNIYLVEGQDNLMFIEFVFDESGQTLTRRLIDVYPATRECRAPDVFNLMVREVVLSRKTVRPD